MRSRLYRLFWHLYGSAYDAIWDSPLTAELNRSLMEELDSFGVVVSGARVFDLGCGTGLSALLFSEAGCQVTGVDIEPIVLERAQNAYRIKRAVCAPAACTGLPDECADVVMLSNVLQVCPEPVVVLNETERLAHDGSMLVAVWPQADLTLRDIWKDDIRTGRSAAQALGAHIGRIVFGITGAMVGARSWSSSALEGLLKAWAASHGHTLAACGELGRISRFFIIQL